MKETLSIMSGGQRYERYRDKCVLTVYQLTNTYLCPKEMLS